LVVRGGIVARSYFHTGGVIQIDRRGIEAVQSSTHPGFVVILANRGGGTIMVHARVVVQELAGRRGNVFVRTGVISKVEVLVVHGGIEAYSYFRTRGVLQTDHRGIEAVQSSTHPGFEIILANHRGTRLVHTRAIPDGRGTVMVHARVCLELLRGPMVTASSHEVS
jgi:hypothetical protein